MYRTRLYVFRVEGINKETTHVYPLRLKEESFRYILAVRYC